MAWCMIFRKLSTHKNHTPTICFLRRKPKISSNIIQRLEPKTFVSPSTWSIAHEALSNNHNIPYPLPSSLLRKPKFSGIINREICICKHHRITHQRHNPWASRPAHRYSIPATWWPAKAHKLASHHPWQKMGSPPSKTPTPTTKHETIRTHKCCQCSADGTICGDASQLKVLRNPRSRNLEMEKKR